MESNHRLTKQDGNWRKHLLFIKSLVFYGLLMNADKLFKGNAVYCQVVKTNEAPSSRLVTTLRGSSIWLNWKYEYIGDGMSAGIVTTLYLQQLIGFKTNSQSCLQVLAKRTGQNGVLKMQSPIPAPFKGRVEVISSNSTLVIHDLQYNESSFQFLSAINVSIDNGAGPNINVFQLKPVVTITVHGTPKFIEQPPNSLDLTENSTLHMRIEMGGNPRPSTEFKWSHLPSPSAEIVPSVKLHPFVYSSTYSLSNINGSYCGRILQTTIKNSVGSSPIKSTNVTVLLKLNHPLNITAKKILATSCIKVKWNRVVSGACFVQYQMKFKNASGSDLFNQTGFNIGEMNICNVTAFFDITYVQLLVNFKNITNNVTAKVAIVKERVILPPTLLPQTAEVSDSNVLLIVGASFGGSVVLVCLIVLILQCVKKVRRARNEQDSRGPPSSRKGKLQRQHIATSDDRTEHTGSKQPRVSAELSLKTASLRVG